MPKASHPTPLYQTAQPIEAGVEIGHVHLKAANLDHIKEFYVEILGFEVMADLGSALFLSAGGYHHHLAFNTWESAGGKPALPGTTGLYHVAIRYPDRRALSQALRRLVEAGWPLEGVNDHGTHEALYVRDPEDNGLELYWDRPRSEWPLDEAGHLDFRSGRRLDLDELLQVSQS